MQHHDIPPIVAQTAANRQLGTLTRASPAYREQSNGCGPGVLIGMGVVPLLGALPLLGSPKWSGLSVLLFIVAGGLFLLAFLSKRDSSPEHHWRYFIYKAGFIREKAGRAEAYAWSDIARVNDKIIEFRRYGYITSRYYRATLHLRNGGSVTFEEGLPPQGHSLPRTLIQEIVYDAKRAAETFSEHR